MAPGYLTSHTPSLKVLRMTKARQRERKKKRQAELRAGIDRSAERMLALHRQWNVISPEEKKEEEEEEERMKALGDAKLAELFGAKDEYSADEIEAMIAALVAEGVLPALHE
jgi:hypothetical protein